MTKEADHKLQYAPELTDNSTYQLMLSYVNSDELTGFYERWQQAIEKFLEVAGRKRTKKVFDANRTKCTKAFSL
ncbi:MAG: hypothetical protein K2O91_14795 [Lachnospiraceae bacterium]|nr:hypothetical protein [Lachnospiraceae bacterium]